MTERRLGRGLEALLGPVNREQAERSGALRDLAIGTIGPNPFQPRKKIDDRELAELSDSIAASGLLQPVVVRAVAGGRFELIAGERRWRAVQRLGWKTIPAVVKEADDRTLLTLAIIENIQRAALSPLEEAGSYQRLIDEFQASQVEVARLVGRDRSTVSNAIRLLRLPVEVRQFVEDGKLSEGHARALLSLGDDRQMVALARHAVAAGWSVREVEAKVRGERPAGKRPKKAPKVAPPDVKRIEEVLRKHLGTEVRVTTRRRGRGFLTVSYYSNDDLARLLERVLGRAYDG